MRTLTSICFRNPVKMLNLQGRVRIYERLMLWNLAALRGTLPGVAMDMFLEDVHQAGVRKEDAADFALTPSSVGGGGMVHHGSAFVRLAAVGTGRWLTVKTGAETRKIQPTLGRWAERVNKHAQVLEQEDRDAIHRVLSLSWGLHAQTIYGKVSWRWKEIPKLMPKKPPPGPKAPILSRAWATQGVPTAIRHIIVKAYVKAGQWGKLMLDEWVPEVEAYR